MSQQGSDATHLSKLDITDIRDRYYNSETIQSLSSIYAIPEFTVERILDGYIEPFAGGPLRPLTRQGCNPRFQESTRNRQRFVRGVLKRARDLLTEKEFKVFCHFNGLSIIDAHDYARNSEDLDERVSQERFRGVIVRHAAGTSVEESFIALSRRTRQTDRAKREGGSGG